MPFRPRSIRGRLTTATVLGLGVILFMGTAVAAIVVPSYVRNNLAARAAHASRTVTTLIDNERLRGDIQDSDNGINRIQVVDRHGKVVAASRALRGRPAMSTFRPSRHESQVEDERPGLIVIGTTNRSTVYGPVIVYAAAVVPSYLTTPAVLLGVGAHAVLLLGIVGFATWYGIGRVLQPVERMRAGMEEITATDLTRRVPVPEGRDELARLATTMNDTLGRLEEAVERQRQFVADASHELRTPITGLITRLELALGNPDEEDLVQTLRDSLRDGERLKDIVVDLLTLASLDGDAKIQMEKIDLGVLVEEEIAHHPSPVIAHLKPEVFVRGSRIRLVRLLTNLLSNADHYGNGRVEVTVTAEGEEAVLEVRDDGPGISADSRRRIFERFTRLDGARSRDAGGTGLGLAICHQIAVAHGGRITVGDEDGTPGARFIVRLPLDALVR